MWKVWEYINFAVVYIAAVGISQNESCGIHNKHREVEEETEKLFPSHDSPSNFTVLM